MVKYNRILSLLSISSICLVVGKTIVSTNYSDIYDRGVCKDLYKFLNKKNAKLYSCGMTEDEKSLTYLNISSDSLSQEIIDKIAPFSSTLEGVDFENIKTIAKNLNLESLKVPELAFKNGQNDNTAIPKNVLKTAKNVGNLLIYGFDISQRNLNDLSTLSKLTTLKLDNCTFDNNMDYTSLKNLKNLTKLYFDTIFLSGQGEKKLNKFPESICQLKKIKRHIFLQ